MSNTSLWFEEKLYKDISLRLRVEKVVVPPYLTGFQKLAIYDTASMGRMLVLDDVIQLCEKDEALYHEIMAHWPLYAHPYPKNVLIIGGGDGGVAREVLKHPGLASLTVVDIDPEVTRQTTAHMPNIGNGFQDHPLTTLLHQDAAEFLEEKKEKYDIIIVDSTDDLSNASPLFGKEFIRKVHQSLAEHGIMMFCIGGSFFLQSTELQKNIKKCTDVFGRGSIQPIFTSTASYLGGYFCSLAAFKNLEDQKINRETAQKRFATTPIKDLQWYSPSMHQSVILGAPKTSLL